MQFQPKTEKQIQEDMLLPDSTYDFDVLEAADKTSKAGNDMIELKLRVYAADGTYRFVTDFLLESMARKLRHAAYACSLADKYEAGSLQAGDFVGKGGQVKIYTQKDKSGKFSDKNAVGDYIVDKDGAPAPLTGKPEVKPGEEMIDDTIPF